MSQSIKISGFSRILALILLSSLVTLTINKPVSADPGKLMWTVVDTPSSLNNVIVSPSEINFIALGSDDHTFYAVDIPDLNTSGNHGRLYKSFDGGITWPNELSTQLMAAGAFTPVWNIAIAPDNPKFIVVVTDLTGGAAPGGPKRVYISQDGGARFEPAVTNLNLNPGEFISSVDVSVTYSGVNRDIAIGTRDGLGTGRVWVLKAPVFGNWNAQDGTGVPPSTGWFGADVVALKFSPTYPSDFSLLVVSSDAADTHLHLGIHDTDANITSWDTIAGYPVLIRDTIFPGISPVAGNIITADIELPSDFSGQNTSLRRIYLSTDVTAAGVQFGVYRVDDTVPHRINPPTSGRISSISYLGTYAGGIMLAGEVTADPALGVVNVWRTSECTVGTPAWLKSDTNKSPTGGGGSGYANAQVAWNFAGTRAYVGTSSACLGVFTTPNGAINCTIAAEWPDGYLNSVALDESAFSVSPYAPAYEQLRTDFTKIKDIDIGNIWNQLSLIDTEIDFLSDVAALEAPINTEGNVQDYNVLYLFSVSDNSSVPIKFNSIWRSTSDPLGRSWERVLSTIASDNRTPILRVRQPSYDEIDRSSAIVFANIGTDIVGYSSGEGQAWDIRHLTSVTDLALSKDTVIYVLNDTLIYRYEQLATSWVLKNKVDSELNAGHTIAVPLKNRAKGEGAEDMVLVGEAGPPGGLGRIAYADFSEAVIKSLPSIDQRIVPPITGDAHVIFDDQFEQNSRIYNAIHDPVNGTGKIYRWVVGESTAWDELEPPNSDFYGLVQRNSVLYGAWKKPEVVAIFANKAGVDRTLYPRKKVPPPPEWDYLVAQLPVSVLFNREPTSLKISSNENTSLWAIDNRSYDFANQIGRLWEYTDTAAKVGPWTTAPASGSSIPVDPKTGRAVEVNFAWKQLSYSTVYEFQLAKDIDFYNRVLVSENITPVDQRSPEVYLPAGALIAPSGSNIGSWANLESGHTYYWRVRARAAITGEIIRSPWSATMYFTVEAGLPTASPYPTVVLFSPVYGARNVSTTPGFSWSGMPGVTKYEFTLAKDAALQQVIVKVSVPMTSYLYDGKLDSNTGYFWQVRAIEPVVSDPSAIGTFTVVAEKKPVTPAAETPAPIPPWVWWIIATFTALVVVIIAFTMVKPSYVRTGGGKLFKVEPIVDKPKSPMVEKSKNLVLDKLKSPIFGKIKNAFVKMWESIIMAVRRWRYLRKSSSSKPEDSKAEDNKPEGSQEKLP
jgi:hypothetical protein